MNLAGKNTARAAALAAAATLTAFALAACASPSATASDPSAAPVEAAPTPTPEQTTWPLPADQIVYELPEWAQTGSPWLVYPEGFECYGTEGCPNSFTHLIGTPSDPLPAGVELYDPERHDGRFVWPKEQSPYMTEGNGQRLDGDTSGILPPLNP